MGAEYKKVIARMNEIVNNYWKSDISNGNEIVDYMKQLSTSLYYLNSVRVEFHNLWQTEVKRLVDSGLSVSRAENEAHVKYKEMYELRRTNRS